MSEVDCDAVLHQLYEFLAQELDEQRLTEIGAHLEGCHHCLEAFEFEAELRQVIVTRHVQSCPAELRRRIAQQLGRE